MKDNKGWPPYIWNNYGLILMKRLVVLKNIILRSCGREPTSKTIVNKISDDIIVVNELNKLDLEIQHQEQTASSLKEL